MHRHVRIVIRRPHRQLHAAVSGTTRSSRMNIYKLIGVVLFLVGLGIMTVGIGGHTQYMAQDIGRSIFLPPGVEPALLLGLIAATLAAGIMKGTSGHLDKDGLFFVFCGTFGLILGMAIGLNESLDRSEPVMRTLPVNNLDLVQSEDGHISYYAIIPSWWDKAQYIPLGIPERLYREITPEETYLEVGVRKGAFGRPYYSDIAITAEPASAESTPSLDEYRDSE